MRSTRVAPESGIAQEPKIQSQLNGNILSINPSFKPSRALKTCEELSITYDQLTRGVQLGENYLKLDASTIPNMDQFNKVAKQLVEADNVYYLTALLSHHSWLISKELVQTAIEHGSSSALELLGNYRINLSDNDCYFSGYSKRLRGVYLGHVENTLLNQAATSVNLNVNIFYVLDRFNVIVGTQYEYLRQAIFTLAARASKNFIYREACLEAIDIIAKSVIEKRGKKRLEFLLSKKASFNLPRDGLGFREYPIGMDFVFERDDVVVLRKLVSYGLNLKNLYGRNCGSAIAAKHGSIQCLLELIKLGAKIYYRKTFLEGMYSPKHAPILIIPTALFFVLPSMLIQGIYSQLLETPVQAAHVSDSLLCIKLFEDWKAANLVGELKTPEQRLNFIEAWDSANLLKERGQRINELQSQPGSVVKVFDLALSTDDESYIDRSMIKIGKRLGEGTYGAVFQAEWRFQEVAVKRYIGTGLQVRTLRELNHEMDIMKQLDHKNLVRFYGLIQDLQGSAPMLLMELCQSGSLYQYLRRHIEIPQSLRYRVAYEIICALAYLHTRQPEQILHCDLKSLNVVLDQDLHAKLCDFGLARLRSHVKNTAKMNYVDKPAGGTYQWMAPELFYLATAAPSAAADIWAFGMVVFELLTHTIPFQNIDHIDELKKVIKKGSGETISDDMRQQHPQLCLVMQRCWAGRNSRPSAETLVVEFEELVAQQTIVSVGTNQFFVSSGRDNVRSVPDSQLFSLSPWSQ